VFATIWERPMPLHGDHLVTIVDDDEDVRNSMQELLQCAGFDTRGYASGREFLKNFDPPAGICIILDLHMPDISGFGVLDALHARGNTIPIVLFSGRSDHTTEEFAQRSGVIALLTKPVEGDTIIDLIQTLATPCESAPN
jgi:two-component system response regulator FixJ